MPSGKNVCVGVGIGAATAVIAAAVITLGVIYFPRGSESAAANAAADPQSPDITTTVPPTAGFPGDNTSASGEEAPTSSPEPVSPVSAPPSIANNEECVGDIPPPLETINALVPCHSELVDNELTLAVTADLTTNRLFVGATFNGSPAPECNFPGGSFVASFDAETCSDLFTARVNFETLTTPHNTGCGFTRDTTSEPGAVVYSGLYEVMIEDTVAAGEGGVTTLARTSVFQWFVDIVLPTEVSVSADVISISSMVDLDAVIVRQDVLLVDNRLEVDILVWVQHPYAVEGFVVSHTNVDSTVTVSATVGDDGTAYGATYTCGDDDERCYQLVSLVLERHLACAYDGDYTSAVSVVCPGCAVVGTPSISTLFFTLDTDDVCARIRIEEGGSLSATALPRDGSTYVVGQVAVFDIEAFSSATEIASIAVDPVVAWAEVGNPVNAGTATATIENTGTSSCSAAVALSATVLNILPDTVLPIALVFDVVVTYVDGTGRRALLQSESVATEAISAVFLVGDSESPGSLTSPVVVAVAVLGGGALVAFVVIVAVAIVYPDRSKPTSIGGDVVDDAATDAGDVGDVSPPPLPEPSSTESVSSYSGSTSSGGVSTTASEAYASGSAWDSPKSFSSVQSGYEDTSV